MNTIVVWALVVYLSGVKNGGPMLIDNIATERSCRAAVEVIKSNFTYRFDEAVCIPIRKVVDAK